MPGNFLVRTVNFPVFGYYYFRMHTSAIFTDLVMIFLVSVPVAILCLRLKLPVLVGFMVTGIAIGPYGFGLIEELETIEVLAEIGVMLLLFTIGIEFSFTKLKEMKSLVLIGGGLQVVITVAVTALAAMMFGRSFNQALYFGFLLALSSTAIVLKSYVDRREIDAPHGRAGVGILLFQDICIVLMMLLVPVLAGSEGAAERSLLLKLAGSLLAVIGIVTVASFAIPKILEQVVRMRSPELLLLTAALISIGPAWTTQQFGLSLALGAFIAGVVLSESEYSHQITADILPFRDVFNSIFFVSMGMLLSIVALIQNLGAVLVLVVTLILFKAVIIWLAVRLLGFPHRIGAMTGLGLAQVGEFSFVLAKAGQGTDLMPATDYQTFLAASIISMIATPFLIAFAPRFGYFVQSILKDGDKADFEAVEDPLHVTSSGGLTNHVIIVGYGLNGRNLARVLRSVLVPYTILELDAKVVQEAKAKGEKINYGDATRRELLYQSGIEQARALVLGMSDPKAARRAVRQARNINEKLYIVVRTRYTAEIPELLRLGASEVIPEEFETSVEIFARVLHIYGVARPVIDKQIDEIRRKGYEMLRTSTVQEDIKLTYLEEALRIATTETIVLSDLSPAAGFTLGELDLRNKTGVTIIAVTRGNETVVSPSADFKLTERDSLVLMGESEKIKNAVRLLQPKFSPDD